MGAEDFRQIGSGYRARKERPLTAGARRARRKTQRTPESTEGAVGAKDLREVEACYRARMEQPLTAEARSETSSSTSRGRARWCVGHGVELAISQVEALHLVEVQGLAPRRPNTVN